jgi:hypothetical protein
VAIGAVDLEVGVEGPPSKDQCSVPETATSWVRRASVTVIVHTSAKVGVDRAAAQAGAGGLLGKLRSRASATTAPCAPRC